MQAPSIQERQEGGVVASSILCTWPGVVPPLIPTSPGPTLTQGSSQLLTPLVSRVVAQLPSASGPPVSGALLLTWPGTSLPPSLRQGPSPSPSPAESVALQAEQLRQARQGSRKTLGPGSDTPAG